jgi:hypothetical protein
MLVPFTQLFFWAQYRTYYIEFNVLKQGEAIETKVYTHFPIVVPVPFAGTCIPVSIYRSM